jgi:hypothetical protein
VIEFVADLVDDAKDERGHNEKHERDSVEPLHRSAEQQQANQTHVKCTQELYWAEIGKLSQVVSTNAHA